MKTTYVSHFNNAAEDGLAILNSGRGLATNLFLGVKALAEEKGTDSLLSEFDKEMIDLESRYRDKLDEGDTLSSAVPQFKSRKSEIRRAIKAGLDPTKFDSFRKLINAIKKDSTTNGNGGKGNTGGKPEDNTGKTGNSPVPLTTVATGLDPEVSKAVNLLIKHLHGVDKDLALGVIKGAEGALHAKLRKVGGALANVKKKTG